MFSSVPAIIRAPIIFEKLVSPLWCFEMRQVCMWHSYKDQNGFYCKLFNLFPSPGSSVLHDSYQPKETHLSGWSSADYPESYLAILGKYNILTSCICIRLSNASLQHNVLPSTKINSERASCCAMGRRGFSSSYLFLKYLDLVNIYRKKKKKEVYVFPGQPMAILRLPAVWGSVTRCLCGLCRGATTDLGVSGEQRRRWDLGRRQSLGSLCVGLSARHSCSCLINRLGRSVFLRLRWSILCNATSPTIQQVVFIKHGFMFMKHWKSTEKLSFRGVLENLGNITGRKSGREHM